MLDELIYMAYLATQIGGWWCVSKGVVLLTEAGREIWIYCATVNQ